jgi:hypothetical protein
MGKSSKALQNIGLVCWLLLQNWWPNKDNSSSQELSFSEAFCQQLFPLLKAMAFGHAHPVGVQSFGGTILGPLYGIQEPSSCFGYPNLELFDKQLRVLTSSLKDSYKKPPVRNFFLAWQKKRENGTSLQN